MDNPGQQNQPKPEVVRSYFRGILQRQYYTESGPLVRRLEAEICQLLDVNHVICISTPAVAWLMLLDAVELGPGRLLLPATASNPMKEALRWIDCPHQLYDISAEHGYRLHRTDAEACMDDGVSALLAINPWGGACDLTGLSALAAEQRIPLLIDSSEAFGCHLDGRPVGSHGLAEVFSFESGNLINGAGSACICTQDETLADRLRSMRSSGGVVRQVPVRKTVNGRMSEAQAAYALIGLECIDQLIDRNKLQHDQYHKRLSSLPKLHFLSTKGVNLSNYQQLVIALDSKRIRKILLAQLQGSGCAVTSPAWDSSNEATGSLKGIRELSANGLQLPLGSGVTLEGIDAICEVIADHLEARN